ncbi:hypothetical protein RRG08_047948 [Elysia crispata]|uniref:Uncharacterized protein n=1 Tax=Elysia crispata TaxID=231223 RepID=A0AAE0XEH7_9GAST|nr:hypothetical protein RRG08_047948 [Elysia crispata]
MNGRAENIVTYTEAGVMMERGDAEGQHRRVKREVNHNTTGFNWEEQRAMLWKHNNLRSTRLASNMMYMEWTIVWPSQPRNGRKCATFDTQYWTIRETWRPVLSMLEKTFMLGHNYVRSFTASPWTNFGTRTGGCMGYQSSFGLWDQKYCPYLKGSKAVEKGYNVVCHYGPERESNYVGLKDSPYMSLEENTCSKCVR